MKEELRTIYAMQDRHDASLALAEWCFNACRLGIPELEAMAKCICTHWLGVLAYWDGHLTSGKMEGFNNKIRALIRQAYGYHDSYGLPTLDFLVDFP